MKQRDLKVAIIGGGPSGIMAALAAGRILPGIDIAVFEKNEFLGRKLLATGNGKCNFSHRDCSLGEYGGEEREFPGRALSLLDPEETRDFFEEIGLFTREDSDGRRYPYSEQAASVKEALERALSGLGIRCLTGRAVTGIEKDVDSDVLADVARKNPEAGAFSGSTEDNPDAGSGDSLFRITLSDGAVYTAKTVIIATGGRAGSQYGSTGDGYRLAKSFGHSIVSPRPALVQMTVEYEGFSQLKGVRAKGAVALSDGKRKLAVQRGEIQFTENGLSGICLFDLSRYFRPEEKAFAEIDLFPEIEETILLKKLAARRGFLSSRPAGEFLSGMIHNKLIGIYVKRWGVDAGLPVSELGFEDFKALTRLLKAFSVPVTGTKGFAEAQVTIGGVRTAEVDGDTLESRLVPGLYFAGEVLDVDGSCGGRNLQWAWSSGYAAGMAAAR